MKLTPARRSVISRYLFSTISRWAAVFGIVNLFAILISLGYVFFVLPKKASDEAQILLRQEISGQLNDLHKTLDELNKLAGRVSERSETTLSVSERIAHEQSSAERNQQDLQKRIATLDAQVRDAEKSNVTAISKFVADFNTNEQAKGLITRLNDIEQAMASLQKKSETRLNAVEQATASLRKDLAEPPQNGDTVVKGGNAQSPLCPPGTYLVGFRYQIDSGGPHGITSSIFPVYRKFLTSSEPEQPSL